MLHCKRRHLVDSLVTTIVFLILLRQAKEVTSCGYLWRNLQFGIWRQEKKMCHDLTRFKVECLNTNGDLFTRFLGMFAWVPAWTTSIEGRENHRTLDWIKTRPANLLTPWKRALVKLIIAKLVKETPYILWNQLFTIIFKIVSHWILFWTTWINKLFLYDPF